MMVDDEETIEIAGLLETETGLAFLIDFGGRMEWIPKSQARCIGGDRWLLTKRFAKKKGVSR